MNSTGSLLAEQAGAICYRKTSDEVLLVTRRGGDRWGIPKGNIEAGESSAQAAEREAFEEAGIRGACTAQPIGRYHYRKDAGDTIYSVLVHVLDVQLALTEFPEKNQRLSQWVSIGGAVDAVYQPELKALFQVLARMETTAASF